MWHYTKCTSDDRVEKLKKLKYTFMLEADCSKYLASRQQMIISTQTTLVLLQDIEKNILIEMDYVPVNDYVFHVIHIQEDGIKQKGMLCKTIEEAIDQFVAFCMEN